MNPKSFNDFLVLVTLRYFIIAGLAYLVWYVLLRKKIAFKKINHRGSTAEAGFERYRRAASGKTPVQYPEGLDADFVIACVFDAVVLDVWVK